MTVKAPPGLTQPKHLDSPQNEVERMSEGLQRPWTIDWYSAREVHIDCIYWKPALETLLNSLRVQVVFRSASPNKEYREQV